jgi:hypothetical protein
MIADAPPAIRDAVSELIRSDKRNHALLLNFAIRAGRGMSADAIVDDVSMSWREPIDRDLAHRLFDALLQSRWVEDLQGQSDPLQRRMMAE